MAPKISVALGFQEHHERQIHRNSSILTGDEDYLDDDEWDEHVKPRRRGSSVEALSSCFTMLSSSLNITKTALTTRAKKLCTRDVTRRRNQLRSSMIEISSSQTQRSLARANSMPTTHRSSESDLDLFDEMEDVDLGDTSPAEVRPSTIKAPSESASRPSRLSRLLPTRSWTLSSKK